MKLLRRPGMNAAVVLLVSAFYALVFHVTAGNPEFTGMLGYDPAKTGLPTLQSPFWNGWSVFLRQGSHRFVGYGFLAAAGLIWILSVLRRREFDEYQTGILEKGLAASGAVLLFVVPLWLLLTLGDPCYIVEYAMLAATVHWTSLLLSDLVFLLISD